MTRLLGVALGFALIGPSCSDGIPAPATLDTGHDACRQCRMAVSDARLAGQIVAPGEEPLFFDDLGCLFTFLDRTDSHSDQVMPYVADHRTREWVRAVDAVFTRAPAITTPMGSHLVAHATPASREADPSVRHGTPVRLDELLSENARGRLR